MLSAMSQDPNNMSSDELRDAYYRQKLNEENQRKQEAENWRRYYAAKQEKDKKKQTIERSIGGLGCGFVWLVGAGILVAITAASAAVGTVGIVLWLLVGVYIILMVYDKI